VRYLKKDKINSHSYMVDLYPHLKQEKLNLSYIGPSYDNSSESESEIEYLET
jgi:hypothetical protein